MMQQLHETPAFRPRGRSFSYDLPYAGKWSLICSASRGLQAASSVLTHLIPAVVSPRLGRRSPAMARIGDEGGLKPALVGQMRLPGLKAGVSSASILAGGRPGVVLV